MKMNPVVHFEMPADDSRRMADFYTKVFGWYVSFIDTEGNRVSILQPAME